MRYYKPVAICKQCVVGACSAIITDYPRDEDDEMPKWGARMVAAIGMLLGAAGAAQAQWNVKAEAGVVAARGNSDSDTSNAKFLVSREFVRWKHTLEAAGVYASDNIGTTGQRWNAREQTDYKFSDKGFWFGSGRYEEDRFSGFEYQSTLGTGLGWRFFDDPITKLSVQIGGGYKILRRRDSLAEDGVTLIPGMREEDGIVQGSVDFEHQLTDTTKILNKLLVESASDNTFVQNDLSLEVRILGSLALALGYAVRYNTDPPPDFTTTDTLTTLNLVYEIE
jgi:putative salt-induced outer membrane protein